MARKVRADHSISTAKVYRVEVELERGDGSRTREFGKWVVAHNEAEAEALALESVTVRWPLYKPLGVTFVGIDHSRRAQRFLERHEQAEPLPTRNVTTAPEAVDPPSPAPGSATGEPVASRTRPDVLEDLAPRPQAEDPTAGRLRRLQAQRLKIVELLMRQTR